MARSFLICLLAIYYTIYSSSAHIDYEVNPNVNCTEDGFLPHPDDCKAFYWCSRRRNLRAIVLECEEDQIFDIDTQSCKLPWESTRVECGGTYQLSNEIAVDDEAFNQDHESLQVFRNLQPDCTEDGFMPDETDCSKFYRCINSGSGKFLKYEFFCGTGTVWDPVISSCNHPWATKRTECGGNLDENNESYPDMNNPGSDNQGQYPNYNPAYPEDMPSSSEASVNQNYPNYPTTEDIPSSTQGSYPEQPNNNNNNNEQEHNNNYEHHSPEADKEDKNNVQGNSGNECHQDGFMGDSRDCKKFYRCVATGRGGFMKYEFSCGQGTVWDAELGACNHQWATRNENCRSGVNTEDNQGGNQESNIPQTDNNHGSIENNMPNTNPDVDPDNPDYPRPISVTQGPEGYPQVDNQENVSTSSEKAKEEMVSTETSVSTTQQLTVDPSNQNKGQTKVECSKEEYVPDPKDCKKFYRCVNNGRNGFTRYEFSCGEGTVWDSDLQACNHPDQTRNACGTQVTSEQSTESNVKSTTSSKPLEEVSEPSYQQTTENSISTTSTETSEQSSPNTMNNFENVTADSSTENTNYESVTNTSSSSNQTSQELNKNETNKPSLDECTREGFIGDSKDCKKFYRCVSDEKRGFNRYEFSCGEGTVWDTELETCNYPHSTRRECGGSSNGNEVSATTGNIPEDNSTESSSTQTSTQSTTEASQQSTESSTETIFTTNPLEVSEPSTSEQPNSNTTNNLENVTPEYTNNEQSSIESVTSTSSNQTSEQMNEKEDSKPALDECTRDGFIGDSRDCKKFYRCVSNEKRGFNRYEFTCGEGTVWDTKLETCNYPHATRRECGNSENSGDVSTVTAKPDEVGDNEEDSEGSTTVSSSSEYSTTHVSQSTESSVSQSTEFSTTAESSSWSEVSNNVESTSTVPSVTSSSEYSTTHVSQSTESSVSQSTEFSSTAESSSWSEVSNNVESSSTVSSVTTDASYSQETSSLSNPTENKTEETTTNEEKENMEMENSTTVSSSQTTQTKEDTLKQDDKCKQEGFIGDSKNCKKFYRCVKSGNGFTKYEFTCGEGTVWDSSLNTCNHAANVKNENCGNAYKPEQGLTTESTVTSTENEKETTPRPTEQIYTSTSTQQPSEITESSSSQPPVSSTEGEIITTSLSTEETTTSEYFSSSTEITESSSTQTSEYTTSSEKENISEQTSTTTVSSTTEQSGSSEPSAEIMSSTSEYVPSITEISEPVTFTSSTTTQTETSQSTPPPKKQQQTQSTCTEEGFFPNLKDCNKFYRCVSNGKGFTKYDFNCGPGTIWDPDLNTCNHPYAVTNKKCGEIQETTTKPNEKPNENTDKPSEKPQTDKPETSTSDGQNETAQDKCTEEGFFPNSKDCKKFYRCVGNGNGYSKYDFTCGEGTIFDPNIQTCNYPHATENKACGHSGNTKPTTDKDIRTDETPTETTTPYEETTIETTTEVDMQSTTPTDTTENIQGTTTESDLETTTDSNLETTTGLDVQSTTDQDIDMQSTTPVATTENIQTTTESDLQTTTDSNLETTTSSDVQSTTGQETTTIETTEMETKTTTESDVTTTDTITTEITTQESQSTTTDLTTISSDLTTDFTEQANESTTNTIDETTTIESVVTTTMQTESTTDLEQPTTQKPMANQTAACPVSELEGDQISLVCPTGFKRHPKYCNLFYQCKSHPSTMEIKILVLSCPSGTIYDDQKIQCVAPKEATQTCMGEIKEQAMLRNFASSSLMPMQINKQTPLCPNEGSYPLDPFKCLNNFIKCTSTESRKIRAYIHQCPNNYTYWPISKRCERESRALGCVNEEKVTNERLKWMIPVEVQNVAKN